MEPRAQLNQPPRMGCSTEPTCWPSGSSSAQTTPHLVSRRWMMRTKAKSDSIS